MTHVFYHRSENDPSASAVTYSSPTRRLSFNTTEFPAAWAVDGSFLNMVVRVQVAPGTGKSWTFTLRKNGIDTAVTCTISGTATTARDTTHTAAISPGDTLSWSCAPSGTPTLPSTVWLTLEFNGTTTAESGYSFNAGGTSTTATRWNGVFEGWTHEATQGANIENVSAAAGTLTAMYVTTVTAPGASKSRTYTIYKNGVKQDGSGGTVDTHVTLTGSATSGNTTFSLSVAAGDTWLLEATVAGTPAASSVDSVGVRFVATTNGESQSCGWTDQNPFTGGTRNYVDFMGVGHIGSGIESDNDVYAGVSTFSLNGLWVALNGTPGSGRSYDFVLRLNGATAGGGPTLSIADLATSGGTASGSVTYADGDRGNVSFVGVSSPSSRRVRHGTVQIVGAGGAGARLQAWIF